MGRDNSWVWWCTIPFWLLLLGASAVAVTEDASLVRFAATVAGGAAISGALIGLVLAVGHANRRAQARTPTAARKAQIGAWRVIAVFAALVTAGAGAASVRGVEGAVALVITAGLVLIGSLVAIWRRVTD